MRSLLNIRTLFLIVAYAWFNVTPVGANPSNQVPGTKYAWLPEKADPPMEVANRLEGHLPIEDKAGLPLVKGGHSNVMDLLHRFLVAKPMQLPSYTPLVQQIGLRINWLAFLRNLWPNGQRRYGGGVDLHFRGPIQLSIDFGYLSDQPKEIGYTNVLSYRSKGGYVLGALLYVFHLNRLSNAYFGVAYGQSRFDLITFFNDHTSSVKPFVAGWIKCVGVSELRFAAQLHGGMQFSIAHFLHGKQNDDPRVSNYSIPGYGKVVHKIMPDIVLYLKWSISFLEKKIVI